MTCYSFVSSGNWRSAAAPAPFGALQQPSVQTSSPSQSSLFAQQSPAARQQIRLVEPACGGQQAGVAAGQKPPPCSLVQQVSSFLMQMPFGFFDVTGQHLGRSDEQKLPP